MSDTTHIYGLLCPVENTIRYVGKSNNPSVRFRQHLKAADQSAKARWIGGIRERGLTPTLIILQTVAADGWRAAERWWIDNLQARELSLTNDGCVGDVSGRKVRRIRDDLMYSQRELAELADISPATLNNIENNNIKRPHPSTMRKLAAALDVPPRDLRAD